jgi:hypothetical protein
MYRVPEDLVICAYALCEDDFSEVKNYLDCVPEALYVLQDIAIQLGIKIRFSTVSMFINHVVEMNRLKEKEVEKLLSNLLKMLNRNERKEASLSLLKILLRKEINIALKDQDLSEIAIAALYASFVKTLSYVQEPHLHAEAQITTAEISTLTT